MSKNSNNYLTIGDFLRLCLRRWKWFVISLAVCLIAAGIHLQRTTRTYTSHATILVKEESAGNNASSVGEDFSDLGLITSKNNVTDVARHISSLDVLMEAARRLRPEAEEESLLYIAQGIGASMDVEQESDKSTIINLTYIDSSPEKANQVLSTIIQVYDDKYIEDKHLLIRSTSNFIDNRLRLLEQDLDMVDDSIASYKSKYGITDLGSVGDVYLQQQSQSEARILELSNQKAMALFIKDMLDSSSGERRLLLVNAGIDNPTIAGQISEYNTLLMQLNSHLTYTSDQNPMIVNLENEIDSLKKSIRTAINHHIQTLDIELASVRGFNNDATAKISSNPEQAKFLASIERDQKVKESLYLYLLHKKEENEIGITYSSSAIRILDIPHASSKPTSPNVPRVLFTAILLGLLLPLIIIFLNITLDDRVRTVADIQQRCDLPVLGEVPSIGRRKKRKSVVVTEDGRNSLNDAFRMLRTRLELTRTPQEQVFLVTAEGPGAGKTFITLNLGMALAYEGRKILLIDGDLRRGKASTKWKAKGDGLVEYLQGKTDDWQALIVRHESYPGLDVLPSGDLPDDPAGLLMSPRLAGLMAELRKAYSIILIDTPSSTTLVDGEILLRYADCILFVLRAGYSDRRTPERIDEIASSWDKRTFIILNAAESGEYRYYSY